MTTIQAASRRGWAAVFVTAFTALLVLTTYSVGWAQDEQGIQGTATITTGAGRQPIPDGLTIRLEKAADGATTQCGAARIGQDGRFVIVLEDSCSVAAGDDVTAALVELPDMTTSASVTDDAGALTVDAEFDAPEGQFVLLGTVLVQETPAQAGAQLEFRIGADGSVCATTQAYEGGGYAVDIRTCIDDAEDAPIMAALPDSGLSSQQLPAVDEAGGADVVSLEFIALQRGGEVDFVDTTGVPTRLPAGLTIEFLSGQQVCGSSSLGGNGVYGLSLSEPCAVNENADVRIQSQPLIMSSLDLGSVRDLPVHLGFLESGSPLFGRITDEGGADLPMGTSIRFALKDGTACGRSEVESQGAFVTVLDPACQPGATIDVTSPESARQATVSLPGEGQPRRVDVALSADATLVAEPSPEQLEANPLIKAGDLRAILTVLIIGVVLVLILILGERAFERIRAEKLLGVAKTSINPQELAEVLEGGRNFTRTIVEGVVLTMVVIALVILAVTGKVTPGSVSVLAAIIGYAAGRATTRA